jgi:hypothetical protein
MHRALELPIDLVATKRKFQPGLGRTMRPMNRFHLLAGSLAVAAFDVYVHELIHPTRPVAFNYDKIRDAFDRAGNPNVTKGWEARLRVRSPDAKSGHWRWVERRKAEDLRTCISAAVQARNAASHGGSAAAIVVPEAKTNLNLMWAEGLIQAVQDLAYCLAERLDPDVRLPPQLEPPRTAASAALIQLGSGGGWRSAR